ncbi:MAG: amino acid ABC transporter permease [Nitrososphaerales archaeon]
MDIISVVAQYWPLLLQGFEVTLLLAASGFVIGLAIGLPTSLVEVFGARPLRWLATGYVEVIRGTPMLVQLFIVYYALPQVGIRFDALTSAIIGMGLNSGAYQAEYFRGAIRSVPAGQMDAALSVGMKKFQAIIYVTLSQALRLVIPAWTNEVVYLVQYSSVAFFVTVVELTAAGELIAVRTFQFVEIFAIIGLIYLATTITITRLSRRIETKVEIPGMTSRRMRF